MNTYFKYFPNVYLAKCEEEHKKGDIIEVQTQDGRTNRHIVFNRIPSKTGFYYSIVRLDGYNLQERAKRKAEQREQWAEAAENKSVEYYKKGNKDSAFLSLGEPIKVGHHSEKKHRKIIEQAQRNATKSCEFSDKAKEHKELAEYWKTKENDINLSIPESLDYFKEELEKAKAQQKFYKENPEKREHSFSLTYVTKKVKDLEKKVEIANRLWG